MRGSRVVGKGQSEARGGSGPAWGNHSYMALPGECQSIDQVRAEIDRIDREILALLGRRAGYVHAAARFKMTEEAVAAPDRQAAMFRVRREWAAAEDLDPEFIERLYRELIAYFVEREREHWKTL